ncbi:hypothetical protein KCP73_06060 [Salmonella enterica subsp. enterica]|nr:hypothetical protein KCP73_06060 [Salmonella enterica subsp. enterica]
MARLSWEYPISWRASPRRSTPKLSQALKLTSARQFPTSASSNAFLDVFLDRARPQQMPVNEYLDFICHLSQPAVRRKFNRRKRDVFLANFISVPLTTE